MLTQLIKTRTMALALCGAVVGTSAAFGQVINPTTPQGITLVEVVRELSNSQPQFLWLRPGDSTGHTLLTYARDDADNARCVSECALQFPPLLAPRDAKVFGDWTLVRRTDGNSQWAYQGRPLYTWSLETEPGEVATNIGLLETTNVTLADGVAKLTKLVPPDDWKVVRFLPAASIPHPDVIDIQMVYSYESVTLTDNRGHTVYAYSGDPKDDGQVCRLDGCTMEWAPVQAPALASTIGDFSVVTRADGTGQWAYKGQALYVFNRDALPGDVFGATVASNWKVAALTRNFSPPAVGIKRLQGYGDTLAANDMTLYGGYAFSKRWGGRNLRDTFKDTYLKGKLLGGTACDNATCLKSWTPFLADSKSQSSGFWEPIKRADGETQWAYKGYAMYRFNGDRTPDDHLGQAVYAFEKPDGDAKHLQRVAFFEEVGKAVAAAGIYWNIAKP